MENLADMTPSQLAEKRLILCDDFAKLGERKVALMRLHAEYYKTFRDQHKSDSGCERAFELTEDGLELMMIREKTKSIEHKLSAIRTLLEVKNSEARNAY